MRKLIVILLLVLCTNVVMAQVVSKTINLTTVGTLSTLLTANEKSTVTNLTITGKIDARDFRCMRDELRLLTEIDLSETSIEFYNGVGGTDNDTRSSSYSYLASVVPRFAFLRSSLYGGVPNYTLKSIVLPRNITSIGYEAFMYCVSLNTIIIPTVVKTIDTSAFYGCSSLTSIILPDSLKTISGELFRNCSSLEEVKLPDSLQSIGAYAFQDCAKLKRLIVPKSVVTIGEHAYYGCSGLRKVVFPNTLESIGNSAFESSFQLDSLILPDSLKNIGLNSFSGSINHLVFPKNWTNIPSAFRYCNLPNLEIPNTIKTIEERAFYGSTGFNTIVLPDSLQRLPTSAFENCWQLRIIKCLGKLPPIFTGYYPIQGTPISLVIVPSGSAASYKASDSWKLLPIVAEKKVNINVPTAGGLATGIILGGFGPLASITHLSVTGNLNTIDFTQMKTNMTYLNEIDLSGSNVVDNTIPNASFQDRQLLQIVKLPSSLEVIGDNAFRGCLLLQNYGLFPSSLKSIGSSAFYGCWGLRGLIKLPENLINLSTQAFFDCRNLDSLIVPKSISIINSEVLANCEKLSYISMPNNISSIGNKVFYGCLNLSDFKMPDSLQFIGSTAFSYCQKLENLNFSTRLNVISDDAFSRCKNLKRVLLPASLVSIGSTAFEYCTSISEINLPNSLTYLGSSAFNNCTALTSLSLSSSLTNINDNVFNGCVNLSGSLNIPLPVKTIGSSAFNGCAKLSQLTLLDNVESIGNSAFSGCTGLSKMIVERTVPPTIQSTTFDGVSSENCFLEVPIGSSLSYQIADYWSRFVFYKEVDMGAPVILKNRIKIFASNSQITIEGASEGEIITLYTIGGVQLRQMKYNGAKIILSVPSGCGYLVKTATKTVKVAL